MLKQTLSVLKISSLALILSFGLSYALAWTQPTQQPPNGNVAGPINMGSATQTKVGGDLCTTVNGVTKCLQGGVSGAGTTSYLSKWTNGSSLGDSQIFDNGTNVGIGTAAPSSKFEARSDGTGASWAGRVALSNSSIDRQVFLGTYNGNAGVFSHNFALNAWAPLYLNTVTGTTGMVIQGDGNVGVGTTTPTAKLDIVGGDAKINGLTAGVGHHSFPFTTPISTALGVGALQSNYLGNSNTAIGYYALRSNQDGSENVAVGTSALAANVTGSGNTANGSSALSLNSSGIQNVAIGAYSLKNNTTGGQNIAIGYSALQNNTTGSQNTAIGQGALQNTNMAWGIIGMYMPPCPPGFMCSQQMQPLYGWIAGVNNTGTGFQSLFSNTGGSSNVANGVQALYSNTTGGSNTATGFNALYSNTTGGSNTASGFKALFANTTGASNTAEGIEALLSNTTGGNNTAHGMWALYTNTTGGNNTAVGTQALYGITTGSSNTAIGSFSGSSGGANLTNSTAIGYNAKVAASNYVRIGDTAVTQIGGQVGWSTLSDVRQKDNIKDYGYGLDFITKLRPVSFTMKGDTSKVVHNGFIAQEVEKTGIPFYGLHKPANEKDFYTLDYSQFVVPLVNSVKELKAENDKLKADNAALISRIEAIEAKLK